jgi:excisionase family DNA binding protein
VNKLLTAAEVAELLSVPTSWVYAEARAGRLPHLRVGRYRRFREAAIVEWIKASESSSVSAKKGDSQ